MEKVKYLLLCVVVIIYVFNECHVHGAKSKYVTMNLDTKWAYTPLMLEASEFLAEEGNEKFWSFVNKVGEQNPESYINDHEEAHYQMTLKFAKDVLSSFQLNLLKFALSMRAHSPRVEMFNQIGWNKISPKSCDAFVDVNNMITCDKESLKSFIGDAQGQPKPLTVKSDHHYPGTEFVNTTVILYCELGTQAFHDWHQVLREMADRREINYILRHYIKTPSDRRVRLSGYGVELAIKSQEYKAKDDTKVEGDDNSQADDTEEDVELGGFDFAQLKKIYPDLKEDLDKFKQHLLYSNNELAELKVWQFQDLSFQAAQMLMSAKVENRLSLLGDLSFQAAQTVMSAKVEDRLRVLRDVSQNFPVQTRFLSKTAVNDDLRKEIKKNQDVWQGKLGLQAGDSAMFINGMQADLDTYDVFTLLDTLKSEAKMMEGMHSLGVKGEDLSAMLKIDLSETETNYAVDYRDPSVVYINNLEKDRRYQGWPSSVTELLRPTFPGMLRHIRKNLFTGVFIVDPSNLKHRDLLKMAEAFYVHTAPVRMGLLFVVNGDPEVDGMEDAGVALYRAFNYLSKEERPMKALEFITEIYDKIAQDGTIQLTGELVIEELKTSYSSYINTDKIFGVDSLYDENRRIFGKAENSEVTASLVHEQLAERRPHVTKEEIFGEGGKQYDKNRQEAVEFFEKTGLGELPQVLINGVPMKKTEMEADNFEESLVSSMLALTPELQKSVYNGFLYDGQDIETYIMTRSNVMPRLNFKVLTPGTKYLDLTQTQSGSLVGEPEKFAKLSNADKIGAMMASLKYLTKKEESSIHAVSNWVIGDLDTPEGRGLVYEAIKQLKSSSTTRLGIVHNPSTISKKDNTISKAIQVAIETLPAGMAKSFVTKLVKEENVLALQKGEKTFEDLSVHNMDMASFNKALETKNISPLLESHKYFCQYVLGFQAGQRGIITNGKIIGPLNEGEKFIQEDFVLLEKFLSKSSAGKIERAVKKMNWEHEKSSDLIMKVASLLLSTPQSDSSRTDTPYYSQKNSVINIAPNDPDSPAYDVVAVLDPSTRAAQKYTPLIMALGQVANANIKVFFNCREKLSDLPLKSFYRYVLEPEVRFNAESKLSIGPSVSFKDLPQKPILTLGVDSPESWLVEAVRALHDLDNIHLQDMESSVHADFELEYLLLEGHCFDSMSGQPPRGLQFVLGTDKKPAIVDTIVMANLGYFQLKAAPGLWNLELRSGKSREIYDIASHEFTDSPADSKDVLVVIDTLKSKIVKVRVAKKPGKEKDNLLSDTKEEEPQGFWDSLSSQFVGGSGKGTGAGEDKDDTINIFSLASGHLYERFMRIMILSVLKTTKSNVKFWFLKNYLSPSFIDFIPHMAAEYNFEYEMVQYKWPRWLHQQTEKQRVMWGYKILFLDVLFPLNINKIIFVDADQIVRTDLKELVDLDLEGAPYGYTPFCDSRTEMDGFRFWKSGYWNSHLAGRRYHISALYVVDLKKFRKIAAGDRLRGQYQGLSQDPNSLSNLDQDLPNNMIHQVPIKSLPQEWLWCETWCSDAEKSKAKTIDLCNNPRTKEPKLSAAVRIVPEWTDYDNEAKALWDKVYKSKTSKIDSKETKTDKKDSHTEL